MLQSETVKKYDTYKDSGIEWIGKIPQNWDVKRLKVLAKLQTGNTPPKENDVSAYYTDEGFLWVKPDNLSGFSPIKNTNEYLNEEGYKIARVVPKGTPLVCCIGSIGKYGVAEQDVAFNQQINAVIFNKMMDNKFGLYHISCQEEQHWYYANGNVVQILNTQNQGKILLACPPINEQKQIAEYLDKKCGEIDRVVETEKTVIEKLKEYKQSIITEAVTKGLDKSAPLKDSGIEWIGKIPQHWEVRKLKTICKPKGVKNKPTETVLSLYRDLGIVIKSSRDDNFNVTSEDTTNYKFVEVNDLVVNKMKAWQGSIAISNFQGIVSPAYYVNEITYKNIYPFYLHYLLRNHSYLPEYRRLSEGIRPGQWDLSYEAFRNIPIIIPNYKEQEEIAEYLDKKCSEIDKAIADKEQVIEKFTEYKKSLIYECVTGKRKVC